MNLLIPAAGIGRRMGSSRNKLLLTLLGKSLLSWTLEAALKSRHISWIGIIGQPIDFPDFQKNISDFSTDKHIELIEGGATRQESVYKGLQALPSASQRVLIHDGARCLATPELLDRCAKEILKCPGIIASVPVKDTIKVVDPSGLIQDTPDRRNLWAAQTPQGFDIRLLKECHEKGRQLAWEVTDDAALFEKCGLPVKIIEGEETNLKVTTPVDLRVAEFILAEALEKQ